MQRRRFLTSTAVAVAGTVAGCNSSGEGTDNVGSSSDTDESPVHAPRSSWDLDFGDNGDGFGDRDDYITVTHGGGDDIDSSTLSYTVGGNQVSDASDMAWDPSEPAEWTVGTSADIKGEGINSMDEIRIIWEAPSGDSSAYIGEGEVP